MQGTRGGIGGQSESGSGTAYKTVHRHNREANLMAHAVWGALAAQLAETMRLPVLLGHSVVNLQPGYH